MQTHQGFELLLPEFIIVSFVWLSTMVVFQFFNEYTQKSQFIYYLIQEWFKDHKFFHVWNSFCYDILMDVNAKLGNFLLWLRTFKTRSNKLFLEARGIVKNNWLQLRSLFKFGGWYRITLEAGYQRMFIIILWSEKLKWLFFYLKVAIISL